MIKDKSRPVNLNLLSFRFPPMALVSIAHRVSGFFLFLVIPWCLYLLSCALDSSASFSSLLFFLRSPLVKLLNGLALAAVWFHVFAGFRHLLMDIGFGESLRAARITAYGVMVIWLLAVVLTGVWLW